jgi:ferredoxin
MKNQWGAFVCTCRGKLPIEPERLGQPAALTYVTDDPEAGAIEFAAQAKATGVDRVVASCCMGAEPLRSALGAARVNSPVFEVDLKQRCFLPHGNAGEAHAKAVRMLNGAMAAAAEQELIPELHLSIGQRVVLVLDDSAGLPLAARLESQSRLTVLVPASQEAFGRADEHRILWGRLLGLQGRLGELKLQVAESSGNGRKEETLRTITSDQLVWAALKTTLPVKRRTGVHIVSGFSADDVERAATDVSDLTGEFLKPQAVLYDTDICAGGAAQHEACGRCIPACPYNLVSRDPENPLRIRVDHLACEGCGACVAACPTGALRYSDPGALNVANTIAGMLSTAHGTGGEPQLVVFHCSERGKRAIEAPEDAPQSYTAQALPVEVPCLRYTSPANILAAFRMGAAGVALLGCAECPHGERELLQRNLATTRGILGAFGLGEDRLQLIAVPAQETGSALAALDQMAGQLHPSPIHFPGRHFHAKEPRDALAEAVETFITQLGTEPGTVAIGPDQTFAMAEVRADGCTLCRSCVNVCPTHAFRFDETNQALTFRHISCIDCGLCEQACPESVITLTKTLQLNRAALEDVTRVQDVMVACTKCGKPFINRKALEAVEAKLAKVPSLTGVFAGDRKALLRMCPDCRAIAAMGEVTRGWQP